ncbi:hypothetical protein [Neobacillus sp. 19]|uniref:hypothetical protein n=1 Tax=Neobacillus sp. 19 TaxID=3394458 RepID=UPI003BF72A84
MLRKHILFTTLLSITVLVSGCGLSDASEATEDGKEIVAVLQEKYDTDFEATHVKRSKDAFQFWMIPKEQPNDTFTAVWDRETNKMRGDGYLERMFGRTINNTVRGYLEQEGLEGETTIVTTKLDESLYDTYRAESNIHMSIGEYVEKFKPEYIITQMIVKDNGNITPETFNSVITNMYKETLNTVYEARIFVIKEKDFEKVKKDFIKNTDPGTEDYFEHMVSELAVVYDANGFNGMTEHTYKD